MSALAEVLDVRELTCVEKVVAAIGNRHSIHFTAVINGERREKRLFGALDVKYYLIQNGFVEGRDRVLLHAN